MDLGKQVEEQQENRFLSSVETIVALIEQAGPSKLLDDFRKLGYTITIYDEFGQTIYPALANETKGYTHLYNIHAFNASLRVNNWQVMISYPRQLAAKDIQHTVWRITPIILGSVFIFNLFGILLYTYLYRNEKKKLDDLFQMMNQELPYEEINEVATGIRLHDYCQIELQAKRMYQSLQITQRDIAREIQAVQRLEKEKRALLDGFTHELKTPIMTTQLLLTNLLTDNLTEEQQEIVISANKELLKLHYLTRDVIFVFHYKQKNENNHVSVEKILNQTIENYEVLWKDKQMTIDWQVQEDFVIKYSQKLAEKIFSNLIANAVVHSPKSEPIYIIITKTSVEITNTVQGDLPPLSEIKQPFTSFGENSGTGLGLYLVEMMLKDSNYDFVIEKQNHTFTLRIFEI